jgi:hypothetical protein
MHCSRATKNNILCVEIILELFINIIVFIYLIVYWESTRTPKSGSGGSYGVA